MAKTLQEILALCQEKEIQMIDFKMTDIDGRWRHLSIPVGRLNEDTMQYGIGFDGSNYGYAPIERSDMVFVPDLDTAAVDPFGEVPTLTMIGDVMIIDRPANRPFDQTRPEASGFRVDTRQAQWSTGNNGYQVPRKAGYHTTLPQDVTQDLRSRICMLLEDWGIRVKYHHPEVGGCGQMEIEVELGEMTHMADSTMAAKYIVKNAAAREGRTATFLPKPVAGEAGSGMHVHMHLFKDGQPIFYDEKGYAQLSDPALWFIGGMLEHAASLCAFTNPSTNSYKRLVPGFEAPVTIGYAMANRSAVVRIPAYAKAPKNKRFELRNPDATCNPYYAFAAILMAGLDGIQKQIDPHERGWGPYDFNLYTLSEKDKAQIDSLPKSLEEALDALEADHDYLTQGGVFPERLIEIWIDRKRGELEELHRQPTPGEYALYYDL